MEEVLEENAISYTQKKQSDVIKQNLRETYKELNEKQLRELAREVIFAPEDRNISVSGRSLTGSQLRYELADNIEEAASTRTIEASENDMQVALADNIEHNNSETNSVEEYFRWLEDTTNILKNMNDGFVTQEDLDMREDFLENADQREAELMLLILM